MLGNFSYVNATKLYFGDDSLKFLNDEFLIRTNIPSDSLRLYELIFYKQQELCHQ